MASGTETLRSIDVALVKAQDQATDLTRNLQLSSADLMATEQREAQHYRELARVRLGDLAQRDLLGRLDSTEQRTRELLEQRQQEFAQLEQQQTETLQRRNELEAKRETRNQVLNELSEKLDELEAQAQTQLADDQAYQAQLERTRAAQVTAQRAAQKTELAEKDQQEKGAPYEADPLFMYLWRRGFGTSTYRANPLIRSLDGWVARLCKYHNERPNYSMLIKLPERLREHKDKVQAEAESQLQKLQALETEAATRAGVDGAHKDLEAADAALDEIDAAIESVDTELAELEKKRAEFAGGLDPKLREATESMVNALREDDMRSLMREARDTPTLADDRIVENIARVHEQRENIERSQEQNRKLLEGAQQRVKELERIRQEFRKRRYDAGGSGFKDGALIAMMLSQFLGGLMNSKDLWGTIEQQQRWQRRRANPGFGSGSLGRGGGMWSGGFPRRRRGGFGGGIGGGGRSGGFGGGGFGTGGGFGGGGGFKTGGGF